MVLYPPGSQRVMRHLVALVLIVALLVLQGLTGLSDGRVAWPGSAFAGEPIQTVVAVGDSITAGHGDTTRAGGWVTRLAQRLRADEPSAPRLINAGLDGDTAAGVLARLDRDVLAAKPRLVIVSIGTNDFDYGVSPASFRTTLSTIVRRLRAAGALVVLVATLPEAGRGPAGLAAQSSYNAIIPGVAAATGAGYFDEFDRWLALGSTALVRLRQDAEHPNPLGYQLLADEMAAFLESRYLDPRGRIVAPSPRPSSDLLVAGRAVLLHGR